MPSSSNLKYVLTIVFMGLVLLASIGFGVWAYTSRQDYKDNSDKKAAQAVEAAKDMLRAELQKEFDEKSKEPFSTYRGSLTYGSVTFNYPKTWSALVDESSEQPINGHFYPKILPGLDDQKPLALRVELVTAGFTEVLNQYTSDVEQGNLKASAYVPPRMIDLPNVAPGIRLDGQLSQEFRGSMVVIKVRDKTLLISTQSEDFLKDFNETVLASLTFVP